MCIRDRYGGDVNDELERETVKFTTTQLVALMDKADVPVAPVNTREAMIVDPHIQHRGLIVESVHPTAGRVRSVRPPARFSATPSGAARPAPMFGQHTDEVLSELLGLEKQELTELRQEGVTV